MQVIKRTGRKEEVSFDKIKARIKKLCYDLDVNFIDHIAISQRVIQGLFDGVTTSELDNLAAETAASMATEHPDYAICLLYTSPSPRDGLLSRMPSSA